MYNTYYLLFCQSTTPTFFIFQKKESKMMISFRRLFHFFIVLTYINYQIECRKIHQCFLWHYMVVHNSLNIWDHKERYTSRVRHLIFLYTIYIHKCRDAWLWAAGRERCFGIWLAAGTILVLGTMVLARHWTTRVYLGRRIPLSTVGSVQDLTFKMGKLK